MSRFRSPIEIRFADIDAFGHVNNAVYLTYFEQARVQYFNQVLGWDYDWSKEGVIVARSEINYIAPIHFHDVVVVGVQCSRMGNKSFDLAYQVLRTQNDKEQLVADGITVMVAFDYMLKKSIEVPESWKALLSKFEG